MAKRVAILQSNYIPWKGYFDLIAQVDAFVLYDDVQYTRQDWRNRNRIKTAQGPLWLTIPVDVKFSDRQKIKDTKVSNQTWRRQHWKSIAQSYSRAPFFSTYRQCLEEAYLGSDAAYLSEINAGWLRTLCGLLGIGTQLSWSMDYALTSEDRTERLIELCQRLQADEYVSGPAAKAYLDEAAFNAAGIAVRWMDYAGYPEYRQLYPPFDHFVSVLDLLLSEGPKAPQFMKWCPSSLSEGSADAVA